MSSSTAITPRRVPPTDPTPKAGRMSPRVFRAIDVNFDMLPRDVDGAREKGGRDTSGDQWRKLGFTQRQEGPEIVGEARVCIELA